MRTFLCSFIVLVSVSFSSAQNLVLGTNGFVSIAPRTDFSGFGFYTRMGVEVFNSEIGLKSFYGRLSQETSNQYFEQEAYGVSLYSFFPIYRVNKISIQGHVEGGFSLGYSNYGGSDKLIQMGLGPALKYKIREYLDLEFILEYVLMSPIASDVPNFTNVVIPTIGWSVRI